MIQNDIRKWMMLCEEAEEPLSPVDKFLTELWEITASHPFNRRQRIVNNAAVIEVRPDINNRDTAIHISDIMSLYPGERSGYGRDALLMLLHLADKYNVTLTLFAKAYVKGPKAKVLPKTKDLAEWYGRYGFKRGSGQMVRKPGTPIPQ